MDSARARTLSKDWENVLSSKMSKDERIKTVILDRPTVEFCTGSSYTGQWNKLGMEGFGTFLFPHGNSFEIIDDRSVCRQLCFLECVVVLRLLFRFLHFNTLQSYSFTNKSLVLHKAQTKLF